MNKNKPFLTRSISFSPQQVKVDAGGTKWLPVFKNETGQSCSIDSVKIEHFSAQGEQDCNITLEVGDDHIFRTGKYGDPNKEKGTFNSSHVTEDRTQGSSINYAGGALTSSSSTGATPPDNFSDSVPFFASCKPGQEIYWKIQNRSSIYNHVVLLTARGWKWRDNSESKR